MSEEEQQQRQPPVKYGDVFPISGELGDQPISPRDAAAMQSAEHHAVGRTLKGGPAAIMQSAASKNIKAGVFPPLDANTDPELVEGQPWHQSQPAHDQMTTTISATGDTPFTIGEALEAAADAVGDKPVDHADAAAIQTAEMRATGVATTPAHSIGAEAQAAATVNARMIHDEDKTTLGEVTGGAAGKLPDDKPATRRDAERVTAAELRGESEGIIGAEALRHAPKKSTTPGGIAEAVATAAGINQPGDK